MSKLYPVGVQNFEGLIHDGYVYVDKTAQIYELFNTNKYYFLSRPRRFGKSLLLSTLEAYAQGKKELFKGLALEKLEKDWTVYPVLHLDLNTQKYDTPESLTNVLEENVQNWEVLYGASSSEIGVARRFQGIIRRACEQTGRRVVILIDEYDKPMLQAIGNEALQNEYRGTLKAFYGALKSMDGCIRFALLTGVTKFGKVSVFSDLNNLRDISMIDQYAEICGISEKEIYTYFEEDIHELAAATGMSYEEACAELKTNYDGYHFTENAIGMYNPFSLLNTFANRRFGSYWFETGTPTYLVELLKLHHYPIEELEHIVTSQPVLDGQHRYGLNRPDSGYLPEWLPHHQGLQQDVRELHVGISQPRGGTGLFQVSAAQLRFGERKQVTLPDSVLCGGSNGGQGGRFLRTVEDYVCRHSIRAGA